MNVKEILVLKEELSPLIGFKIGPTKNKMKSARMRSVLDCIWGESLERIWHVGIGGQLFIGSHCFRHLLSSFILCGL